MSRSELAKLRQAVREAISELYNNKRGTTRGLVEAVRDRHPDLVRSAADQLLDEAIAGMSRRMMKSEAKSAKSAQFVLPMEIAHLKLPAAISVPPSSKDDLDEVLWTPIDEATYPELERHITMLVGSIAADTRRLRNLRNLLNYVGDHMADEWTAWPLRKILAELAKRDPKAA